jgi:hypothetical protein
MALQSVQGSPCPVQATKAPFGCKGALFPQIRLRLPRNFDNFLADRKTFILWPLCLNSGSESLTQSTVPR